MRLRTLLLIGSMALGSLTGCDTLNAILSVIPPPTPQEQCESQGGRWLDTITYDAQMNPTDNYSCIVGLDHK